MSNLTRAILIGFGVAFAVALVLGFLLSVSGETHMGSAVMAGLGAGVVAGFVSNNLAGNRKIASASGDEKRAALDRAPPAGKALLYIYREGFVAKLVGLNLTVDGRAVGQLKSPRFTCVVVPAGAHAVSAQFGGPVNPQGKATEISVDVPADGAAAIRITVSLGFQQGGAVLTVQEDISAARQAMAGMPMTPPDIAEL
jgi:hypothetical protein